MGKTYKAVEISKPGIFHLVERSVVAPGEEQVRIRIEACGVCHSDAGTVEGQLPGVVYPFSSSRSACVDSATILPATVTRTLPSAGEIVIGWSGPGILISLPLLVFVSIALLTLLITASSRRPLECSHL
jgi:NADPH:quinone reductase-like Zn-dependent oxidoreductase